MESFEEVAARAAVPEYRRWHRANDRRHELRQVWRDFFATKADVLVCPVFSRAAFPHTGDDGAFWPFWRETGRTMLVDGVETRYQRHVFWSGKLCKSEHREASTTTKIDTFLPPLGLSAIALHSNAN